MVRVKLYATLRDDAGAKYLDVPFEYGKTAGDLLHAIAETCPPLGKKLFDAEGEPSGYAHIFVDGRNVMWLDDHLTVVLEEHDIDLIPPIAGG